MIPPAAFVAANLGPWRRSVLNYTKEAGEPACKAFLQVAEKVVAAGVSLRAEQMRAGDDRSASVCPSTAAEVEA